MTVTIRFTITRKEINEFRKSWFESNLEDITDEDVIDAVLEHFYKNPHEYTRGSSIEREILEN